MTVRSPVVFCFAEPDAPGLGPPWDGVERELGPLAFAGDVAEAVEVEVERWGRDRVDLWQLDRQADRLGEAGRFAVRLRWADEPTKRVRRAAADVLVRCQRWSRRRGVHTDASFERVRARHRALHDLEKPLVAADYAHALDAWQWTLHLSPDASLAVQLAALLHDIERLESEADARREHRAADYQAFKAAHAAAGAELAGAILAAAGVERDVAARAAELVRDHDRDRQERPADAELQLLEDADALSFFSLNAAGFWRYFGAEHARRKVRFTLSRMSDGAVARLDALNVFPPIAAELARWRHTSKEHTPWSKP